MARVVFATNNFSRKPEFQLITTAQKQAGKTTFKKSALSKESRQHILALQRVYKEFSKKNLRNVRLAKPLHIDKDGEFIDFEDVSGKSMEKELLDATLSNDSNAQLDILNRYVLSLQNLVVEKSQDHKHSQHKEILGEKLYEHFPQSKCIRPGLLDYNFDNLIDDGKSLPMVA